MPEPAATPTPLSPHVAATKAHRNNLDEVLQRLRRDADPDFKGGRTPCHPVRTSRERSLAITNLQQAIMWLGMDLKALREEGDVSAGPNPYPASYGPASPVIEPTADNIRL